MKIVAINSGKHGSTGNIMLQIAKLARKNGHKVYTFSGPKTNNSTVEDHSIIGNKLSYFMHRLLASVTGFSECFSLFLTLKFLKKLNAIKPDVIHMHNLHGWYINLPLLFKYIKKNNIKVVWTLHDCWAFTGCCAHFDLIKCEKWKSQCCNCSQYKEYPSSFMDNSKKMYKLKNKWFSDVKDLTIVTPSQWLADLVKLSFLNKYPIKVINNGINLEIFKPVDSDFRKKYQLEDKFMILGVAFGWGYKKGLDVFIELSKRLDDKYKIVLVGTDDNIDRQLPPNIISIHRTHNQKELAEIYTAADVFVNPTREDTYPTVNMEALSCGTPIITFNSGGSPEILDNRTGFVISQDDIEELISSIENICQNKPFKVQDCVEKAIEFNAVEKFETYVTLYEL